MFKIRLYKLYVIHVSDKTIRAALKLNFSSTHCSNRFLLEYAKHVEMFIRGRIQKLQVYKKWIVKWLKYTWLFPTSKYFPNV